MPIIPALSTISGEIAAAPHNNNYTAIRSYVNDYAAFKDVAGTISALQTHTAGLTVSSGTTAVQALTATTGAFSSTVTVSSTFTTNNIRSPSNTALSILAQGTGQVEIGTSVSTKWIVNSTGHLITAAADTSDIGTSTDQDKPRDLHLKRNAAIGGTLTVNGATSLQAITGTTVSGTAITCTTLTASGAVSIEGNTTIGNAVTDTLTVTCNSITLSGTAPEIYCGAAAGGTVFNLSNNANTGNYIAISDPNGDSATSATMTLMGGFSLGTLHLGGAGLATNATKGFIEIPDMAGTPSGAAANYSVVWDSTNFRLMIRSGGAWKTIQAT